MIGWREIKQGNTLPNLYDHCITHCITRCILSCTLIYALLMHICTKKRALNNVNKMLTKAQTVICLYISFFQISFKNDDGTRILHLTLYKEVDKVFVKHTFLGIGNKDNNPSKRGGGGGNPTLSNIFLFFLCWLTFFLH